MERSKIISVICILGFIGVIFSFPQVFSPSIKKIGMFVPGIYGLIIALQFISFVGLWHFKQWGVLGFIVVFFGKLLFSIGIEDYGVMFYIFMIYSLISAFVLIRNYKMMRSGF